MEQLEDVATWSNVSYQKGDIVLIRTGTDHVSQLLAWKQAEVSGFFVGHIAKYYQVDDDVRRAAATVPHKWAGVKQDKAVLAWIWDNKFVCV